MSDLLVVGAGPCGLAVACAAKRAGLTAAVIDRGSILDSIRRFPESLRFFSTPDLLEIDGAPFAVGDDKPRRDDCIRYWAAVARERALDVRPFLEALAVESDGRGFQVPVRRRDGTEARLAARFVVIATGAFEAAPIGIPGESLPHVDRYFHSPLDFVGLRAAIVGGKNSACEAALALARAGVDVTMVVRRAAFDGKHVKYWVLPDLENRIREGRVRAVFEATPVEITSQAIRVRRPSGAIEEIAADRVLALTGYGPDATFLRRCGAELDEHDAPVFDRTTFETPRPGLFVAGVVTGGKRSGRVFVENGRFHGPAIVQELARR